jgi:thiamine biosynthesis lipoprotein ApbE
MKKAGNPAPESAMLQHRTFTSMHSVVDMIFPGMTYRAADSLCKKIRSASDVLETLLSDYDPAAETYILNEKAPHQWVPVSERLWDILTECRHFHTLTKGYFDIGSGWHKKAVHGITGKSVTGIRLLESDERQRMIRFSAPGIALDFGAIGKGLLLRETDKLLTQCGVENCFISFGGSSILTRGHHPHGDHWPVDFRSRPDRKKVFCMKDDFASFSQGTPAGMNATAHMVNPYTNRNEGMFRVSGVMAGCPVIAEVVSTVLILSSPDEAAALTAIFRLKKAFVTGRDQTNQPVKEFYYES